MFEYVDSTWKYWTDCSKSKIMTDPSLPLYREHLRFTHTPNLPIPPCDNQQENFVLFQISWKKTKTSLAPQLPGSSWWMGPAWGAGGAQWGSGQWRVQEKLRFQQPSRSLRKLITQRRWKQHKQKGDRVSKRGGPSCKCKNNKTRCIKFRGWEGDFEKGKGTRNHRQK